jgi:hypothetical protein
LRRAASLALALALWTGAAVAGERAPASPPVSRVQRVIPDTVRFDQEIQNGNAIAMTMTNYGFYGNNFFRRDASFEYPANRGYEHMVRGGLWVGAEATDDRGEFPGVTCGTVDASAGPNSTEASEFTPSGLNILKRSTLPTSAYYDPLRAVSELDFVSDFNDFSPVEVANSEKHRPMHIEVHHESYQWNFAEFQNILFLHITVTNRGRLLDSVWVGFMTELASGCKKCYSTWPPSTSDPSGLGMWWDNKYVVFDDSLALMRETYCQGFAQPPADPESGCRFDICPYWVGLRYLGTRGLAEDTTTRKLTFSIWHWAPGNTARDEDRERYPLMSTGLIQPIVGDSILPGPASTNGPVEVFAVGPFPMVYRDSSITVDFAYVGGSGSGSVGVRDIQKNSKFAQFAYDNHYILPVPPPAPRFAVVSRDTALDFYWDRASEDAYDATSPNPRDFEGYRVYLGEDPDSLRRMAQFDVAGDTASFNTGFDAVKIRKPNGEPDSVRFLPDPTWYPYKFTVHGVRDGFKYYCAVAAFDLGNSVVSPLESGLSQNRRLAVPGPQPNELNDSEPTVFPNPYRVEARWDRGQLVRDHYLWFANLPERCTLRIFTLAGDLLFEKEFEGSTYRGEGARGVYDPSTSLGKPTLSGTMYAWNLITRHGQAIASGLYLYSVEDHTRGDKYHVGKFLVIKADREGQ